MKRPPRDQPSFTQLVPGVAELVGKLALLRPLLGAMGIRQLVEKVCPMERDHPDGVTHGQVVEVLLANRLVAPQPLSRITEWAEGSGVATLFGVSAESLNDSRVGRTLDALTDGWDPASGTQPPLLEELQSLITLRFVDRFRLTVKDLGYDTTSLLFEGEYDESEIVKFGYSRDHRPDCKQIVVGVAASIHDGVVVHGRLHSGNEVDCNTTLKALADLNRQLPRSRKVLVTDRGMLTPKVTLELLRQGEAFVASLDMTKQQAEILRSIPQGAFVPVENRPGYQVAESEVEVVHGEEIAKVRAVAVLAPGKVERDRKARERALEKIDARLAAIASKVGVRRYKNLDYTRQQVGKVFEGERRRYRRLYSIEYREGTEANSVEGMVFSLNLAEFERLRELDGRYFIITALPKETHDAPTILDYYKKRDVTEQAMRILKKDLKIRPVFLQKDSRVAALAYLTVFALMVFTLLTALAKRLGIGRTARHVFDLFWTVVFVRLRQMDGKWLETFLNLTEAQMQVFKALGLPLANPP